MTKLISMMCLLILVNYSYAENKLTFDEKIEKAELIFVGKLTDRFEKLETIKLSNGETSNRVYTTHIFNISEVLKGQFGKEMISVKLLGGCDSELNKCDKYNRFTYRYDGDPNETALLFLSYDDLNKFYYSIQDSETAFLVHGSIEVITDPDWVPIFASVSKTSSEQDNITLEVLRNKLEANDE